MYVNKLELRNIRSYENAEIELSKGINIIVGANNSGKSTILRSLQKLQNITQCITKDDIRKGWTGGQIYIELKIAHSNELSQFKNYGVMQNSQHTDIVNILFNINKSLQSNNVFVRNTIIYTEKENGYYNIKTRGITTVDTGFNGLPDKEDENNFIYNFLSNRQSAYSVDDDFRNLPSKIQKLSNGSNRFNKAFVKYCLDILGFQIGDVPSNDNTNNNKLGIYVYDDDIIYLESMGEGVANVLGLLSVLFTKGNKLILIEELENDIHPASLKKLLDLIIISSKQSQFVISTHSNIVLKYLASTEDTKIFFTESHMLPSKSVEGVYIPTSKIVEVENTPEKRLEILEKLGYDLMDFDLYCSYIILEESSAERIIRDFIIPEFVPDLINKVKTIAAGGASDLEARFNDFLRLFVYIHSNPIYSKKAWVIADGDETGHTHTKNLKEKFKNWDDEHFINFKKSNFEEYYPTEFYNKYTQIDSSNKQEVRQLKKDLLHEVLEYIRTNRDKAKEEFRISAKEVIDVLTSISDKLK
jgi:AAA15 family ATPase/GTPase